jgi:hypothetical protein
MVVLLDMETGKDRCINGLHVQTFIRSPFPHTKGGTVITFANGDNVTVEDDFDHVYMVFAGIVDG